MTRWQIPIVLAAVVVGTAIGLAFELGDTPERVVVPALVGLLTLTFAGINGRSFTSGIRPHPTTAAASFAINFAWTPVFAGLLGWLLLSGHPDLRLGLVMLLVLPIFVAAFTGAAADVPFGELAGSVAVVLGIPLILAGVIRFIAARTTTHDRLDHTIERAQPVGLALLAVAITAIFASHARVVTDNPDAFLRLLAPLIAFFAVTYLIATAVFRDRPLIAVALVVGPLIELPVLALTANRLQGRPARPAASTSRISRR